MSRRVADRAALPVLSTWLGALALVFTVQLTEGLGRPSEGLAISSAALPALLVSILPPRWRRTGAATMIVGLGILALANALYHRSFDDYLSLGALAGTGHLPSVLDFVAALLIPADLLLALIVLAVVAALLVASPRREDVEPPDAAHGRGWSRAAAPTVLSLVSLPSIAWAGWIAPTHADNDTGGFLYAHVVDARHLLATRLAGSAPTRSELEAVQAYVEARDPDDGRVAPYFGVAGGSNVLMVQVEALNGWLLDVEVDGEPVTPVLRSLAERGLHFTQMHDQTHEGRSSDGDHLVMLSQHPLERGAISMLKPALDLPGLGDVLREKGYTTLSAHAHHRGFWNAGQRRVRYGFEDNLFDVDLGPGDSLGFGLTDSVFVERVAPVVASLNEPWLAWLITLTMHAPYPPTPPHFGSLGNEALAGSQLGSYLLRARHTDRAIGRLLESLRASGALRNTMVVLYGDHGENRVFDAKRLRDFLGIPPDAERPPQLDPERVPLIVLLPGDSLTAVSDQVGGLIDIGPTVLSLLGETPPPLWMGRSLIDGGPRFSARASGAVVGRDRWWTDGRCLARPGARSERAAGECAELRERGRRQLEASWIVTRYELAGPPLSPPGIR